MSFCMDQVDCAYVRALFPAYLLEQPIGHELWKIYLRNRKLFHKLKNKGQSVPVLKEARLHKLKPNVSHATRKEIWEKLMNLGVLGTVPYNSVGDEYLMQVYQYFYPDIDQDSFGDSRRNEAADEMQIDSDSADLTKPVDPIAHLVRRLGEDDDGEDDDEDLDDDDDDDDDDEDVTQAAERDDQVGDDEDEEDDDDNIEDIHQTEEHRGASDQKLQDSEKDQYFSPLTESSHQNRPKKNYVSMDIYKLLGYPLPHAWDAQSSNSMMVSSDGSNQLKPNPSLEGFPRRSDSIVGSGFSVSYSSYSAKFEYVSARANNSILSKKTAIFYYEIRVLSVTSSQSGQNCNIKVGFKDLSKFQAGSASPSRTDLHAGDPVSINRQSASIMRSTVESSSTTSTKSRGDGFDKGSFGYCGQDGYITDGTQYKIYGKQYGRGDVIGCGVNFVDGTIFFTKNGINLGTAFTDVHDLDLVPFIALKPGNMVRTNFGLHEEFVFDILNYQRMLKSKAYHHIYKSIDGHDGRNDFESSIHSDQDDFDDDPPLSGDNRGGFLLQNDERFSGDKLYRPEVEKLNNLSTDDDSIPCAMHAMINDHLIHEGLIDVAKGFLKDLQKDCIPNSDEERARLVIRHNERQIIKEENNLKLRQSIRRFINEGDIAQCLVFINSQYPGLIEKNVDLLFELKVAEYLLMFVQFKSHSIDEILRKGQELTSEFVYSQQVPADYKDGFRNHLNDISSLLAYDNPLRECNEDLAVYLTPAYLQDRLFQLVNSRVLAFLEKKSESSLESMVSYTRAMIDTLMEYGEGSSLVHNDSELRFHKLVNIDEDLLNM